MKINKLCAEMSEKRATYGPLWVFPARWGAVENLEAPDFMILRGIKKAG